MPLNKQVVPVVFEGGLDTHSTKETVMPGQFLVLENCTRTKRNRTQKRYGFEKLGIDLNTGAGAISNGKALAKFKEDLLLFGRDSADPTQDKIYSYLTSNNEWVSRGAASAAVIDTTPIIRNSYKQSMGDIAIGNGLTLSVWEDSRGGVRGSVIDNATDAAVLYDFQISATATRVKCMFLQNNFVIVYLDGAALKSRTISTLMPTSLTSEISILGAGVTGPFDICAATADAGLYAATVSGNVQYGYIQSSGVIGTILTGYPAPIDTTFNGDNALTIIADEATNRLYVAGVNASDEVNLACNTYGFINPVELLVLDTATSIRNITMTVQPDAAIRMFYEVSAANTYDHQIIDLTFTWDGSATPVVTIVPASFMRSVGLATKAFVIDAQVYVGATFETDAQPTYFMIRGDGLIVARILGGLGGGLTRSPAGVLKSGLTRGVVSSALSQYVLLNVRLKLQASQDDTVLSTAEGLNRINISIGTSTYSTDTLGENLHVAGGMLLGYDGVSVFEHGFNVFPEEVTSSQSGGTATFPTTGTYSYQVTYEWVDARGQIHRSAPSFITSQNIAATTDKIELVIPKLRLTAKQDNGRAPVKIVIYRTEANLSAVFYKLIEIANDNTVEANTIKTDDQVTYTDTNSAGANLSSNEILYTTGGVLENIAPAASKVVARSKNRLFLGDGEDETLVQYSREWVFGEGVCFSDGLGIRVDALGGKVTAIGALDDKVIIFKKDRIFAVTGDGPVDTGQNNTFTLPSLISGDVGTSDPDSLVIMPEGLMFKSDKGIYLLSTGMQLEYIGSAVDSFNSLKISGAVLLEDLNEVRYTTSDGQALVYNYFFKQWSTFTNYTAESCVIALNSFLHLKADGTVNQEKTDTYGDNGQTIKMALETSWFSLAGLQGFQRVYWLHVLGQFRSHHYTEMKLAYDFESVYNETVYFDTRTGLGTGTYGDTGPYGTGGYGGTGSSTVYQFRCKPKRQRCESMKIRLEDIDTIGLTPGASFDLVAMSFVVGTKKNGMRQSPAKTVGSNI
jgi:hypothetical protein